MLLRCPVCNNEVDSTSLRMEWGAGGYYHCPACNELVRISLPYRVHVALLSLLIAVVILIVMRIRNPIAFLLLAAVIWVPVSLFLNAASSRIKPPTLKAQQRRSPYGRHSYELLAKGDHVEHAGSTPNPGERATRRPSTEESPDKN